MDVNITYSLKAASKLEVYTYWEFLWMLDQCFNATILYADKFNSKKQRTLVTGSNVQKLKVFRGNAHHLLTNPTNLVGEENHICLLGVCLFITYVPNDPPSLIVKTPLCGKKN